MPAIPEPIHTTAAALDRYHESQQEPPRPHLGASQIGHKCERFLWLSFRWAFRERFSGRMLRLFRRGQMEESTVLADLRAIGVDVQDVNPITGKQHWFGEGHFGGSCDGLIFSGLTEAPKTKHVLEIKTHSVKSFADLKAKGVQASKPMHWAQMQVYMHAFGVDRAFYYAVCKDTDEIYTERVKAQPEEALELFDKAKRLSTSDRMPPPLSTDPTWYECKYCPAHDLCHGSKLTREVNCRTCAHSTATEKGGWTCAHWEAEIPTVEAQRNGCDEHILHPDLVPWQYESTDKGVIWLTPVGGLEQPKVSSNEVIEHVA